jgi:hypothetical protein
LSALPSCNAGSSDSDASLGPNASTGGIAGGVGSGGGGTPGTGGSPSNTGGISSSTGGVSSGGNGVSNTGGNGSSTGGSATGGQGGTLPTGGTGGDVASGGTGGASMPPPELPTEFDNPIIRYDAADPTNGPGNHIFTADGAALVWKDKVYLYTGHDEAAEGASGYRMFDFRLWVSSDLESWQNAGAVMRYDAFSWARGGTSTGNANASQVVQRADANGNPKFYFYARGIPLIFLDDTTGTATHAWRNLDPTVLVDDDGRVYMYWGNGKLYWAELEADMIHLKGETYTTNASGVMQNRNIASSAIHVVDGVANYTEAPYLSKRGDLYYLTYASGFPETISYATSTSPTGPWQSRGVILDRVANSGTVHQSIFDFFGQSFISYHDGSLPTGDDYRRSTCMDRLYYNEDGTIEKVVPTRKQ